MLRKKVFLGISLALLFLPVLTNAVEYTEKDGLWKYYDKNGKLAYEITYKNNKPISKQLYEKSEGKQEVKGTDIQIQGIIDIEGTRCYSPSHAIY